MEGKKRSRSIARRLNAELEWRKFFKNFFLSIVFGAAAVVVWCLYRETAAGGGMTSRAFVGRVNFFYPGDLFRAVAEIPRDIAVLVQTLFFRTDGVEYGKYFLFQDITYTFGNDAVSYSYSAENIFALVWFSFLIFNTIGLIQAVLRSLAGSETIRKYLKPLDDIANLAEQLSAEQHSVDEAGVRSEVRIDPVSAGIDPDAIDDAIGEIDDISDSGTRIEFHQTELEGLESALNNMLDRLEESKKKQIRFVDDASHELRTPIAVIHGYAEMLDRWGKDDPKVRDEAIAAIMTESEHMTTLIDQLLFLARGEMDRHVLNKEEIDAQALLDEIMVESEMLDAKHVYRMLSGVEPDEDAEKLTILADPAMIKQSVRILRDNAVKYTPDGGEVSFKAYARSNGAGKQVCIEVGDTGIGIPSDELPRIFDRFYRGTNARTDNSGGSGLGLSIAQWIVKEHGGSIEAISGSGFGTKMTIVLPAA